MFGDQSPRPSSLGWRSIHLVWPEIAWSALAIPVAFYLRGPELLEGDKLDHVLLYAVIGLGVAVPTFGVLGIDSAMSRFFSMRDAWLLAAASVVTAALTAFVQFSLFRLDDIPRSLPVLHAIVMASGLILGRIIARQRARRRALPGEHDDVPENVIIVGATRLAWFYLRTIDEIAPRSRRVLGIVDRRPRFAGRTIAGRPILGGIERIARLVEEYGVHGLEVHRIVVADERRLLSQQAIAEIEHLRGVRGVEVQFLDDILFLPRSQAASPVRIETSAALDAERARIACRPFWLVKRLIDIVVAGTLLVLLAPLAILMVPLTVFDVGLPLMFWQSRIGRNGRPISVYKFRTLKSPIDRNGRRLPDDKRVSIIGRVMRASRLDEIPQLVSILRGDMSIVGPRPLLPVDQPDVIGLRLLVAPGLTGWAQVNGGRLVNSHEKNALDEWYVRHASLWLDLSILVRTPLMVILGDRRGEAAIAEAIASLATSRADVRQVVPAASSPGPAADAAAVPARLTGGRQAQLAERALVPPAGRAVPASDPGLDTRPVVSFPKPVATLTTTVAASGTAAAERASLAVASGSKAT